MAKIYSERTWKARPKSFGGKKYKMVFQGRVKDFKKPEVEAKASRLRGEGSLARVTKKKTHRGMEWVIYKH